MEKRQSGLLNWLDLFILFQKKKEIQEVVLSILIEMMNGAELKSLLPYNDPRCRIGLYQVLEKLILCPNPHWPAPLNYASAVLNSGMNDPNVEVRIQL